jgi:hypothetical protein
MFKRKLDDAQGQLSCPALIVCTRLIAYRGCAPRVLQFVLLIVWLLYSLLPGEDRLPAVLGLMLH